MIRDGLRFSRKWQQHRSRGDEEEYNNFRMKAAFDKLKKIMIEVENGVGSKGKGKGKSEED